MLEKKLKKLLCGALTGILIQGCGWKYLASNTNEIPKLEKVEKQENGYNYTTSKEADFNISIEEDKLKIENFVEIYNIKNKILNETTYKEFLIEKVDIYKYKPFPTCAVLLTPLFLFAGIFYVVGGFLLMKGIQNKIVSCEESREKKIKTKEKVISQDYVTKKVSKKKYVPVEKTLKESKALENSEIMAYVYDERSKLFEGKINTNNKGIAYLEIEKDVILNYTHFLKKEEVSMFKRICDLNKVYNELGEKSIEVTISYTTEEIKGEKSKVIRVKEGNKEKIKDALKKANCF